jgi:hypothetical protein
MNTLYIVALAAVIGVMSWRDMHPKQNTYLPKPLATSYYAGADITPAMVPDDNIALSIGLGTFSYARDGKVSWKPQGMPPTTFAQRQINLQFHFNNLPHDPKETIKIIKAAIEDWTHKGDIINVLLFDYNAEKPDLDAYKTLLRAAHEAFHKNYVIYSGINILWAEGPQKNILNDLHESSPRFLIQAPQAPVSPQLFSKLEALKYDFVLQFPAGTQPEEINRPRLEKLDFLTGIALTLDPHKPLPKKEDKIGLFPKL